MALEEIGFTRGGSGHTLFKHLPTEPIDAITFKPRSEKSKDFSPAKYVVITGDKYISPDNVKDLSLATSIDNINGSKAKVILILPPRNL